MGAGLTSYERSTLTDARDAPAIKVIVITAISERPNEVSEIVSEATRLLPRYADEIVRGASASFPGHASAIAQAGGQSKDDAGVEGGGIAMKVPLWSGEVSAGGSLSTGNTDSSDLTAAVKANFKRDLFSSKSNLTFDRREKDGSTTAQRFVLDNDSRYRFAPRFFVGNFLEYRDDQFSGFDYEVTENPGIGYIVVDREALSLSVQAGPAIRLTKNATTGEQATDLGARASAGLEWNISENATFTNDLSVTLTSDNTVSENKAALTSKLIGRVDGRLSFEVRNESAPPASAKKTDTITRASLVYGF